MEFRRKGIRVDIVRGRVRQKLGEQRGSVKLEERWNA